MFFTATITETLERKVRILATSEEDAMDVIKTLYDQEEIVLDYNDFQGVEFKIEKDND